MVIKQLIKKASADFRTNYNLYLNLGPKEEVEFAVSMLSVIDTNDDFLKNMIIIHEATFHASRTGNQYNCRIWDLQSSHEFVKHECDS